MTWVKEAGSPVVGVLDSDSHVVELEGRLHSRWMEHSCAKEGKLCGFFIGQLRYRPSSRHNPGVGGQHTCAIITIPKIMLTTA